MLSPQETETLNKMRKIIKRNGFVEIKQQTADLALRNGMLILTIYVEYMQIFLATDGKQPIKLMQLAVWFTRTSKSHIIKVLDVQSNISLLTNEFARTNFVRMWFTTLPLLGGGGVNAGFLIEADGIYHTQIPELDTSNYADFIQPNAELLANLPPEYPDLPLHSKIDKLATALSYDLAGLVMLMDWPKMFPNECKTPADFYRINQALSNYLLSGLYKYDKTADEANKFANDNANLFLVLLFTRDTRAFHYLHAWLKVAELK